MSQASLESVNKPSSPQHLEMAADSLSDDAVAERITLRTYFAMFAFVMIQAAQVWSLQSPAFLASFIVKDPKIGHSQLSNWIPVTSSLGQAVLGPFFSVCSDRLGHRKYWIFIPLCLEVIGAIVASRANSLSIVLLGQALSGIGLGSAPLTLACPSEILPRRIRPTAQAWINLGASAGAVAGVLASGSFLSAYGATGWRYSFYVQAAFLFVAAISFFFAYNPDPREVPRRTVGETLHDIDAVGTSLFAVGLCVLLVGISVGNNPYPWTSAIPIALTVVGFAVLALFGLWEFKRKNGILGAAMFRNRNFPVSVLAIFVEGIVLYGYQIFYPNETFALWESRPVLVGVRAAVFTLSAAAISLPVGIISSKFKTIRIPLAVAFAFYLAGVAAMSSATASSGRIVNFYAALLGIGFAPLLILLVAAAQLSTPPKLIASTTAVLVSSRALGATVGPAFLGSILTSKTGTLIPADISKAVLPLGLPESSLGPFISALSASETDELASIPGVTPQIIGAGVAALMKALADSFRYIWLCLIAFAALGLIVVLFLREPRSEMNAHVDAPLKLGPEEVREEQTKQSV